ncbi:replicative DNA helicase [Sphingobium cupriresistens]|uniref:DNA 5'-3' helicase n=1 Tax=Sphingobium cupriresistens LL01 TaxID=1420583 RepID=A0A0J7Y1Z3_9SPHN|nr:DnaB-like helicase C-terminal domain-containing protein [Sphingobium cupriresistens]KMS57946.1 replicative DNA helicase [Sphingobium cupriresistens LL01]
MIENQKIEAVKNVESEATILGALMIENKLIDRVADRLSPDDFSEALFGRVYSAIIREFSLGRTANPVTLKPYLSDDPALMELGGVGYLAGLTGSGGAIVMLETCVQQVIDMAKRRKLIDGLTTAAMMAADMSATNEEVVGAADAALSSISDHSDGVVQVSASQAFNEMLAAYDEERHGVTSGGQIHSLDEVLGPIRPHHLDILAGRPGMGKTSAALSYALGAAAAGHGVLFVSLEMNRIELMQRATSDVIFDGQSGIPYEAIRDGRFTSDNARRRVYEAARVFRNLPLHLVDASSLTIGRLNMIVRRYKRRMEAAGQNLELVMVDYLQLLRPDFRTDNMNLAVSEVSRGLKAIAKQYDLGVMALAQLNRSVESRPDKRPMLSDLRDSGQIEQDADAVVFLYRDEYYLRQGKPPETDGKFIDWQMAMDKCAGQIDFIVAKRRNGPSGSATGRFFGAYQAVRGAVQ